MGNDLRPSAGGRLHSDLGVWQSIERAEPSRGGVASLFPHLQRHPQNPAAKEVRWFQRTSFMNALAGSHTDRGLV